jgi:hypothetical protein
MAERMAAELGHEAIWLVRAPALGLPDVMARALPHGVTESNPRDAAHRLPNAQIGSDFFEGKAR